MGGSGDKTELVEPWVERVVGHEVFRMWEFEWGFEDGINLEASISIDVSGLLLVKLVIRGESGTLSVGK